MNTTEIILAQSENYSFFYRYLFDVVSSVGITAQNSHILVIIGLLLCAFLLLFLVDRILRNFFNGFVATYFRRTKTNWDNYVIKNSVQVHLSRLILVGICFQLLPQVFIGFASFTSMLEKLFGILIIFMTYNFINSSLKTIRDILRGSRAFADKPLDSYLQVLQIFLLFISGTLVVSLLTGNSPWSFLVSLGAASAVLMLVFKDTILGFVASIQVSANDSVRVGDWIEMPKYGADGDVLQINLNNVRIQNWDKTIVTIPTHTLLTDSFKNYRGMQESGGRRIKRSINIKISSIRYLAENEVEKMRGIEILKPYISKRSEEIFRSNIESGANLDCPLNGRRMTNIGLFRNYIRAFVDGNAAINKEMTILVRQLASNEHGLPIELYMFTKGTQWSFYEETMSDIFDHLLASVEYFDLTVFELPASGDFRTYGKRKLDSIVDPF